MVFETTVALEPAQVLERAKTFFASRDPRTSAFIEKESARHVVMRGQGGEEVVISAVAAEGGTKVRGSSLLFCQQVKRFLSTLPPLEHPVERVA